MDDQGTYLRDLITINDTLIWSVDRTDSVIAAVRPSVATAFATASAAETARAVNSGAISALEVCDAAIAW